MSLFRTTIYLFGAAIETSCCCYLDLKLVLSWLGKLIMSSSRDILVMAAYLVCCWSRFSMHSIEPHRVSYWSISNRPVCCLWLACLSIVVVYSIFDSNLSINLSLSLYLPPSPSWWISDRGIVAIVSCQVNDWKWMLNNLGEARLVKIWALSSRCEYFVCCGRSRLSSACRS